MLRTVVICCSETRLGTDLGASSFYEMMSSSVKYDAVLIQQFVD